MGNGQIVRCNKNWDSPLRIQFLIILLIILSTNCFPQENSYPIFCSRIVNNEFIIEPIALINNQGNLKTPPMIAAGKYDEEAVSFINKFLKPGDDLFYFNHTRSLKRLTIDKDNEFIEHQPRSCFEPIQAKVSFMEVEKDSTILCFNEEYIIQSDIHYTAIKNNEKDLLRNEFLKTINKRYSKEGYELKNVLAISFGNEKLLIAQCSFNSLDYLIILDDGKYNNYTIGLFQKLHIMDKGSEEYYNFVKKFIDAVDLDKDNVPELIFYESGGGEAFGYEVYKRINNKWTFIYSGGGGGC